MYSVQFRHDLNLLDIQWHGLFDPDSVATYAEELKVQFRRERFRPGYLLRMDMSESAVQTQDAVTAFQEHFSGFPKARRIAIVTPSAIARLQVQREMTQPYLRMFDTADAALEWLLEARDQDEV